MVARLMVDRRVVLATSLYGLVGLLQVMMNEVCVRMPTHVRTYIHHTYGLCMFSHFRASSPDCTLHTAVTHEIGTVESHMLSMSSEFT